VKDKVSHPYKTTGKIKVLYILMGQEEIIIIIRRRRMTAWF
jgi:hypothetical protein